MNEKTIRDYTNGQFHTLCEACMEAERERQAVLEKMETLGKMFKRIENEPPAFIEDLNDLRLWQDTLDQLNDEYVAAENEYRRCMEAAGELAVQIHYALPLGSRYRVDGHWLHWEWIQDVDGWPKVVIEPVGEEAE
jgi:hypothetical protein